MSLWRVTMTYTGQVEAETRTAAQAAADKLRVPEDFDSSDMELTPLPDAADEDDDAMCRCGCERSGHCFDEDCRDHQLGECHVCHDCLEFTAATEDDEG